MSNIRKLPPALQQKAKEELNEVEDRIPEDIEKFRSWIQKQTHIKARTSDQFLVSFLRACKWSIEKAKTKLDAFYTIRTALPEIILNRNLSDLRTYEILRQGVYVNVPPIPGNYSPVLIMGRAALVNVNKYHIRDMVSILTILNDIQIIEDDNFVVTGVVFAFDCARVTASHILQYEPLFIKKVAMLFQEASPFRLKGFHFFNTPKIAMPVVTLFKALLNSKNAERIFVYGNDYDAMFDHIPKKLFPTEYGGDAGPIQDMHEYWEKKMIQYKDYIAEEKQYGTNEKLRPGKSKNSDSLFGVDGTFRMLNLD